mmetsp:Transcript_10865/g.22303  ORF Transcript_10865/g.22303 Transcript_10865/m.22303 type:complete len:246 (-) Transcript_10865:254-991(-)
MSISSKRSLRATIPLTPWLAICLMRYALALLKESLENFSPDAEVVYVCCSRVCFFTALGSRKAAREPSIGACLVLMNPFFQMELIMSLKKSSVTKVAVFEKYSKRSFLVSEPFVPVTWKVSMKSLRIDATVFSPPRVTQSGCLAGRKCLPISEEEMMPSPSSSMLSNTLDMMAFLSWLSSPLMPSTNSSYSMVPFPSVSNCRKRALISAVVNLNCIMAAANSSKSRFPLSSASYSSKASRRVTIP